MKKTKIKPQTKIYKNVNEMFKDWTKARQNKLSTMKPNPKIRK